MSFFARTEYLARLVGSESVSRIRHQFFCVCWDAFSFFSFAAISVRRMAVFSDVLADRLLVFFVSAQRLCQLWGSESPVGLPMIARAYIHEYRLPVRLYVR